MTDYQKLLDDSLSYQLEIVDTGKKEVLTNLGTFPVTNKIEEIVKLADDGKEGDGFTISGTKYEIYFWTSNLFFEARKVNGYEVVLLKKLGEIVVFGVCNPLKFPNFHAVFDDVVHKIEEGHRQMKRDGKFQK